MGVIPPSGILVVAEAEGNQACHIRLQNEVLPPALPSPETPPPPPMMSGNIHQVNGRPTGQILLQDSSVPPPFNYNPEPRSRKTSRDELDAGDGYLFDYNMEDTECLLRDEEGFIDEDDEDFRNQMKIAEQFINATGDVESTDDELEYPWRRHMSSDEEEDRCNRGRQDRDTQTDIETDINDGLTDVERAEREKKALLIKANYAVPPPPTRAVFPGERSEERGKDRTPPRAVPEQQRPPQENGRPYQRLGYSPPKPVAPRQKPTRNSVIKDSEKSEIERSKRHKNSLENGAADRRERTRVVEDEDERGARGGGMERGGRIETGADRQTHLEVVERDISRSAEELSTRSRVDIDIGKCRSEGSASSLVLPTSDDKENYPHGYNERRKRAPGHVNHKVEIEIGQFKVKKTATAERGSVPPLPPRSSSLNQKGPRNTDPEEKKESFTRAPWFKAGIPKDIAFEILRHQDKGAFIVRESKSHAGCYAISIKVDTNFNDSRIANYLVVRTKNGGYTIKGFGRDFADLPRLVHYYSLHQEQLPCKLVFSGTNPLYKQGGKQGEDSDLDEDPDYKKLTDFSSMLL